MFRLFTESYSRLVKYHEEYKESDFSEAYQEPSPYDYHRESSNWGGGDTQPTQTIEMIDKKWPDGDKIRRDVSRWTLSWTWYLYLSKW